MRHGTVIAGVLWMLAACGEAETVRAPQDLPRVMLEVGRVTARVQVAGEDTERAHGLMFVRGMPEGEGMLFVWPEAAERSFWMRNTYIPLDLMYVRGGRIIKIIEGARPLDETALPSGGPADMVLEMNAGWAARNGVAVGDALRVTMPVQP